MKTRHHFLLIVLMITMGITALSVITWINYRYAVQNPGGSDFMIRWLGTRNWLMEGKSPYSVETSQAIQRMFYGRVAQENEDQLYFVYPLYSTLMFFPYSLIPDYHTARAVWMTTLELFLILIAAIGASLVEWKIRPLMLAGLLAFSLLWYYGLRVLINGNLGLVVALLVTVSFLAIRAGHDWSAGILLALATSKPSMVVLLSIFILIWAFSRRRWKLFWSFTGGVALLSILSCLFIPDWIWQSLAQIVAYPGYAPPGTPMAVFEQWIPGLGYLLGWVVAVALVILLLWEWRAAWGKEFSWFLWTAYLSLVLTNLIGVQTATENYMVMFPALVMVFAAWDEKWGSRGRFLVYLSSLFLFFGIWWMFLSTIQWGDQPMQGLVMYFPLPVFLLIGLYSVRRWVLCPQHSTMTSVSKSSTDIERRSLNTIK